MSFNRIRCLPLAMLALGLMAALAVVVAPAGAQQPILGNGQTNRNTVPSLAYFRAIEQLYEGDYRDAERTFTREIRGAIKIGVTNRWLDSIAYHAMLGEVYYHQGRMPAALEQYNLACSQFLQNPNWMIRVDFKQEPRVDTNTLRQPLPWGTSKRTFTLGRFPDQELVKIGDLLSANRAAQQGGVVQLPQFWKIDVIEIVRATTLAIRRRNELLGPLGKHDTISRELATVLARGNTIPNHWSKGWADLQRGVAYAGVGDFAQAEKFLSQAERVQGRFDHPLTCVALLELGKLKLDAGELAAAADLFAEASYSAFYYDDYGIIDEAFRLGTINHLASGPTAINAALEPAADWAARKRYYHINARVSLALAEEALHLGNLKVAQVGVRNAQSRMRDAANGLLGNQSRYLDASLQYLLERDTAAAVLAQALQLQIAMSTHNLQLALANQRYDQRQLSARTAVDVYQLLLSDPAPADWVLRPFETLARLRTPHDEAYARWLDAVLSRKDMATSLEITDLAKRHRYQSALSWGGRLAALRDTLETPEHLLSQNARNQRNDLLLRYPGYNQLLKEGQALHDDLSSQWQPGLDEAGLNSLATAWRAWDNNLRQRETMLGKIGLQRAAVDISFPPIVPTATLQTRLQQGQAIAVFHDTPSGTLGFLVTATDSTTWQCAPQRRLDNLLVKFLRDLGNYDANHQMPIEELLTDDWHKSGQDLYEALFDGSSLDPGQLEELIVVPDGVLWYVPFAALPVPTDDGQGPLIATAKVRIAPTVGLAVDRVQPWRRIQRSALVGQSILPGDSDQERAESLQSLRDVAENPVEIPGSWPAPSPVVSSLTDVLVVLDEVEIDLGDPLAWSPIPAGRNARESSLSFWLTLPQFGPQRILMPAARNLAERGGKASKRKSANFPPGSEMFLAACGLMSTGAQTVWLSSWRVGGDATLELTREFLQELPYTTAADAWQRSIKLAMELPLIPELQPRVKASRTNDAELTAAHPFFWAGYTLIDTGAPGAAAEDRPAQEAPPSVPIGAEPPAEGGEVEP